ncbi:hypothetical protein RQP46_005819 [Phenoliferia psychrophenolica]
MLLLAPLLLLAGTQSVLGWNTDVHQQIGYTAEEFLHPSTKSIIGQILEPAYNGSIGRAAAWADAYAHTEEGEFSYQWHWIDSSDSPPASCSLFYNRDCTSGGCVVSAIANQTKIFAGCVARAKAGELTDGSDLECSYALKWLVHFLGDITQPLHASGAAIGGNGFPVTYNNVTTQLHSVWDGKIIYTLANVTLFPNTSIAPFFESTVSKIKDDLFFEPTASWLSCVDPSTPLGCALEWARESNAWTCDYVYSQIFNGTDLATSGYATGAGPIVELQTAKAGLRVAVWLNAIVKGDYNKARKVILFNNPSWVLGPDDGE